MSEKDWKLFRKKLPQWQERYMAKLIKEYIQILDGNDAPSEKFWALDERMKKDKKCPGVIVYNIRRSSMHMEIARMLNDGVITKDDLEGFSEEVTRLAEPIWHSAH